MKEKIKILIYLYYPFFDNHLAGGVQVWLRGLIEYIKNNFRNINLQIICPDGQDYEFPKDINVNHSLIDMERDFIEPRVIYNNLKKIKKLEEKADMIWLIDRNFPLQTDKPKLLSLNTFCYEREVKAIFQSGWDNLAVYTNYVKNQIIHYVDKPDDIYSIPCYLDPIFLEKLSNKEKGDIANTYFPYDPENKYILFPHRADPDKGHITAINILNKLIKEDSGYRLLIPMPPKAKLANVDKENEFIEYLVSYVRKRNLEKYIIFHPWVLYRDLPGYYSIGECTLFLSKLPETFGITLLNSVSVGTPVISYGVGALNEVVPPGNGHINIKTEEQAAKHILRGDMKKKTREDREKAIARYRLDDIARKYVNLFYKTVEGKEG